MYNLIDRECPFCNSTDELILEYFASSGTFIHCVNCDAHGPICDSEENAAHGWNTRVPEQFKTPDNAELIEALEECLEYFADREDINDHGGPNKAMQLAQLIRSVMEKAGGSK